MSEPMEAFPHVPGEIFADGLPEGERSINTEHQAEVPLTNESEATNSPTAVERLRDAVAKHPLTSALAALGAGCLIGVALHERVTRARGAATCAKETLREIQARLARLP